MPDQTRDPKGLLSLGHGYSARYLARRLLPQGWTIFGTTRDPSKFEQISATGVTPIPWERAAIADALAQCTKLLISAGPNPSGDPAMDMVGDLLSQSSHISWTGYLSTTGVYGDHQGGWVDEDTDLTPATARGMARVKAEAAWQELARTTNLNLHIFRLAGIYGPGRGPFSKLRNGTARRIIKPNQLFSRIHVEDIAQVLEASIRNPNPGAIYNLCDDNPAPPEDVLEYAANLLGLPVPPPEDWERAEMTPMARSFYSESKRVRNEKIKRELGVTLIHPTYQSGLTALLQDKT